MILFNNKNRQNVIGDFINSNSLVELINNGETLRVVRPIDHKLVSINLDLDKTGADLVIKLARINNMTNKDFKLLSKLQQEMNSSSEVDSDI